MPSGTRFSKAGATREHRGNDDFSDGFSLLDVLLSGMPLEWSDEQVADLIERAELRLRRDKTTGRCRFPDMPERSARFQVTWCDDANLGGEPPADLPPSDYIVLELQHEDLLRLKKQVGIALALSRPSALEYACLLFHGTARAQAADKADGTTSYPPSLLSEEVLAESPRPERWKPV